MNVPSRTSKDKRFRVVTEHTTVEWNGQCVTVPKGFEYRIGLNRRLGIKTLITLFGPRFALEDVSAAHDFVYKSQEYDMSVNMSRKEADEVMRSDPNDPYVLKQIAYYTVRVFGYVPWNF